MTPKCMEGMLQRLKCSALFALCHRNVQMRGTIVSFPFLLSCDHVRTQARTSLFFPFWGFAGVPRLITWRT